MSFSVHYSSTDVVSPKLQSEIVEFSEAMAASRSWMSCEPPFFDLQDGYLVGDLKPRLSERDEFDDDDLSNGTLQDALEILRELSLRFGIEWEVGHDYVETVGFIRRGELDAELMNIADAFSRLPDLIADSYEAEDRSIGASGDDDDTDDDDQGPAILKFPS